MIKIKIFESQRLMFKKQFERLHKNDNKLLLRLLKQDPFLKKKKKLMKKIVITIIDD